MAFYRKFNITHWAPGMGLLPFTLTNSIPQAMPSTEMQRIVPGGLCLTKSRLLSIHYMDKPENTLLTLQNVLGCFW